MSACILQTFADDLQASLPTTIAPHLPIEVILQIVSYVVYRHPNPQSSLYALCLVSHTWYDAAVKDLYYAPALAGRNYQLFVQTVCPSINLHIRHSEVAPFVKVLDLSKLVHEGSKSVMGRLLGRVKGTLEVFTAPQTSFSVNALPALSKCTELRLLNLSLVSVSLPVLDLLRALSSLKSLMALALPRCAPIPSPHIPSSQYNLPSLPLSLRHIEFACNLHPAYLPLFHVLPPALTDLSLNDSPRWNARPVDDIIGILAPQITHLTLRFRTPKPGYTIRDPRRTFPSLRILEMSADRLCGGFFSHDHRAPEVPSQLTELTINASSGPAAGTLSCGTLFNKIFDADGNPGAFYHLRRVQISRGLKWRSTEEWNEEYEELDSLLVALEREEMERSGIEITEAVEQQLWRRNGVREFDEEGGVGSLRGGLDSSVVLS